LIVDFYDEIVFQADLLGIHAVFQKNFITSTATRLFCTALTFLCEAVEHLLISHDIKADDKDRF
jgi:hypothetical protein